MIERVKELPWNGIRKFYIGVMERFASREVPNFVNVDEQLVRDVRKAYVSGKLTQDEVRRVANNVDEDWARGFLDQVASNSDNSQLKLSLANEGVSLTYDNDVGDGKRFSTLYDKALYVADKHDKMMKMMGGVLSNIVGHGWGFVKLENVVNEIGDDQFNSPAIRDSLGVDVPSSYGGASTAVIGAAETAPDEARDLSER